MEEKNISINTPSMKGIIKVGTGIVRENLERLAKGQRNFVVTDSEVFRIYKDLILSFFDENEIFILPSGEINKNFINLYKILEKITELGLHRTSRLFAIGGGVVGDIGGLAASLYMRGISCVQIPTTLLAQVDSSVGGKTAVDLGGVKNVVGAFYQPCEVIVDTNFLKTLPLREVKCGLGEIIKYGALNKCIYDKLKKGVDKLGSLEFLSELISDCIQHKVDVVEEDEKETGLRKSLNVGHTTGHAVELSSGFSHGECVLWGMYFESKLAIKYGVLNEKYGKELISLILSALKVEPFDIPDFSNIKTDADKARSDKKNTDNGKISMAVAKDYGKWEMFSLSFEDYRDGLAEIAKKIKEDI